MGSWKTDKKGFTLIEVLISMAILLVGALAIVPLFVFASGTVETNNRRTVAAGLANAELERIRAMEFKDIGLENGNPSGILEAESVVDIDGVVYSIKRHVGWIAEAADCTGENGQILWDYKLVGVEVTAAAPNRLGAINEKMETQVARSVFQEPSPGSGLRICAFRGWKEKADVDTPVDGVKVTITGPDSSNASQWTSTSSKGSALFFLSDDKVGEYRVNIEAPLAMMVQPGSVPFRLTVPADGWAGERAYVEYPCYISVTLKDALSGNMINQPGFLALHSHAFFQENTFSSVPISEEVLGPIWPLGADTGACSGAYSSLTVRGVEGYHDTDWNYQIPVKSDGSFWDGTFLAPNTRLPLTVYMVPVPPTPTEGQVINAGELGWLGGNNEIVRDLTGEARTEEGEFLLPVKFFGNSQENALKLSTGITALTALAMYWEGDLEINSGASLTLDAELLKFAGWVKLGDTGAGLLTLGVPAGLGIDGSLIEGGTPGVSYGEVHFVKGLYSGESDDKNNLLGKGAFYFPDGIRLPEQGNSLIPWHKLN